MEMEMEMEMEEKGEEGRGIGGSGDYEKEREGGRMIGRVFERKCEEILFGRREMEARCI